MLIDLLEIQTYGGTIGGNTFARRLFGKLRCLCW
jgi:hypothetical protein